MAARGGGVGKKHGGRLTGGPRKRFLPANDGAGLLSERHRAEIHLTAPLDLEHDGPALHADFLDDL